MNRRSFLRFLGFSPVLLPAAMVAASRTPPRGSLAWLANPGVWDKPFDVSSVGPLTLRDFRPPHPRSWMTVGEQP